MAENEGFKHITVTAADDEDVVIMAGASEGLAPAEAEGEPAFEGASAVEPADKPASDFAVEPKPEHKSAPKSEAKSKGDYRETTLEDLQGQSMPLAQRIVIIAAIICIIGAVIYYFAFMR